jgi:hypothetical protein
VTKFAWPHLQKSHDVVISVNSEAANERAECRSYGRSKGLVCAFMLAT